MKFVAFLAWLVTFGVIVFLVIQPVSLNTHFVTAMIVIIVIAVLKMFDRRGVLRAIVLALGAAVVLRYVYWRTTSTIPPVTELTNFVPGILLYLAEMYSVLMLFLALFTIADPFDRPRRALSQDDVRPTVDVFVPSLNEGAQFLATTLSAAKQLDYPSDRLAVYLLDDGGTDERREAADPAVAEAARNRRKELQALAHKLGVKYLTRGANINAKAGNLNNGLAHSCGEFVVVFDADHAPARDFLNETLGHFADDERLFLVQTPHFFINPDPLEHNLETWNRMPSENEMFYGVIQKGLDKWNASFFCGSAAVLRRSALEEIGGFAGTSVTEDAETSLELHARGWNSAYVERPMIAGLQPETFANFIGQRSRWCQGMTQILMLRNPLLRPGLSVAQRLSYLSSMCYWLFPLARTIFLFAPLCYLFFGLSIFEASGAEFAGYTITYLAVNVLLQNYLWSGVRWPFISELYETIQSVYLVRALGSVLVSPKRPTFRVTAKGETNRASRISELGAPFYVIFFLLAAGVVAMGWRVVAQPSNADIALVVGGWNLFNLLLMGAALGVVAERRQLRTSQRVAIERPAEIIFGDRVIPARIDDVSITGARILVPANGIRQVRPGDDVVMRFKPAAPLASNELPLTVRSVLRDDAGMALGAEFAVADPKQYALVADLVFADSQEWVRFQAARREGIGVVRGTVEFVQLSLYQTVRGLSYLLTSSAPKGAAEVGGEEERTAPIQRGARVTRFPGADPSAVVTTGNPPAIVAGSAVTRSLNPAVDR
ncbi:UDP-forming cellulose synthase catalytic subunit [Acuticoccus sp.]|uniref:UDP-forming cellulose synthase catalytic subunit n=1 Tax=Acuticoccus sp. TaxID=1904378 RepID=UPI003B52D001